MRKIYFNKLSFKNRGGYFLIVAIILIIISATEVIDFPNKKMNGYLHTLGMLINAMVFSQVFWYRNYVEWNAEVMNVRLNEFWGKSIKFKKVKTIQLSQNQLTIVEHSGLLKTFDTSNIDREDLKYLADVIAVNAEVEIENAGVGGEG